MNKIEKFTKENLTEIRNNLFKKFQEEAKELGIDLKFGTMTFSEEKFTVKTEAKLISSMSNGKTSMEIKTANLYLADYNVKVGQVIPIRGNNYEIIGFNTRASKNPIEIKCVKTGSKFRVSGTSVNTA